MGNNIKKRKKLKELENEANDEPIKKRQYHKYCARCQKFVPTDENFYIVPHGCIKICTVHK